MRICRICGEKPALGTKGLCGECRLRDWHSLLLRRPICTKCGSRNHTSSSQWCQQCINARLRERRKENPGQWYRELTPEAKMKRRSRAAIYKSVSRGKMKRLPCEICGNPKSEAHHFNGYDWKFRYDVKWLCKKHHLEVEHLTTSHKMGYQFLQLPDSPVQPPTG